VWSLVLGIASFLVAPVIAAIPAIITGRKARKAIRNAGGAASGAGMATAGQVLGWANIAVSIMVGVLIVVGVAFFSHHKAYTSLEPGDCFNHSTSGLTGLVTVVGCAKPHQNETVGSFEYVSDSSSWPGATGFAAEAGLQCRRLAVAYVNPVTRSALEVVWVYPGRTAWNAGTRKVVCAVRKADNTRLTGSVR
jgi:hypothetical protein